MLRHRKLVRAPKDQVNVIPITKNVPEACLNRKCIKNIGNSSIKIMDLFITNAVTFLVIVLLSFSAPPENEIEDNDEDVDEMIHLNSIENEIHTNTRRKDPHQLFNM